ncbi:MAG: gliding motility protein GldM [Bacteroidia bacterium]|nr:gliding motility protein GldM [Bacteroidia bacterium]
MAGGKETPRQKMIGMMYLVLTALLALNVSKEILNAFAIINAGLIDTNRNFAAKNEVTFNDFVKAMQNDPVKVKPYKDKAEAAMKDAKNMYDYVDSLKTMLFMKVEQVEKNVADTLTIEWMDKKDNYDIPTHELIGDDPGNPTGKAKELKQRIIDFRGKMLNYVDEKERGNMNIGLKTDDQYSIVDGGMVSWETNNFYHIPCAAVIAIMSRIQNEIKNAESDILKHLYTKIDASSFKFDTLAGRVVASSNYVLIGDEYRAEIFVAAFSTTSNPTVFLGEIDSTLAGPKPGVVYDTTSVVVSKGVGVYKLSPSSEGENKYSGLIRVKNPSDNSYKFFPFKSAFMSARPAAVVSPTKMNVLYIGVDNPISVSVPGVPAEKVRAVCTAGSLSPSGKKGDFVCRVKGGAKCNITVSADFGGTSKPMGNFEFRIKPVPDPVANFAGKRAGDPNMAVSKSAVLAAQGVLAEMVNFDFDLKFKVVSFEMSMTINGVEATAKSNGNMVSPEQKTYMTKVKAGSKIYIDNVKVVGPDGTMRTIPGLSIKVI